MLPSCSEFYFDGICSEPSVIRKQVSYDKPFVYQYQCSSAIIQAYSTVYMFKFCSEVAWSILLQAYIAYVFKNEHAMAKAEAEEFRCSSDEEDNESLGMEIQMTGDLNPIQNDNGNNNDNSTGNRNAETDEPVMDDGSADTSTTRMKTTGETVALWLKGKNLLVFYRDGMSLEEIAALCGPWGAHSSSNKDMTLFNPQFFAARTVGLLAIMLIFGPFVPIIGLMGGITIFVRIAGMRLLIGRVLGELSSTEYSRERGSISIASMEKRKKKVLSKEEKHRENLLYNLNLAIENMPPSLFWASHRLIIYLSAFWYACVIIDMYAIDVSFNKALAPALVLVCFPLVLECVGCVFRLWYSSTKSAAENSDNDDRSTLQAVDTRTSRVSRLIDVDSPMHSTDNDVIPSSCDDGGTRADVIHEL